MGVHGQVFDNKTNEPIEGAEVFVTECRNARCPNKNPISVLTNANGQFWKLFWPTNEENISERRVRLLIKV